MQVITRILANNFIYDWLFTRILIHTIILFLENGKIRLWKQKFWTSKDNYHFDEKLSSKQNGEELETVGTIFSFGKVQETNLII